jgi:heat shock protein HslJ
MILRRNSSCRTGLAAALSARSWGRLLGLALLAATVGGCGGATSTDTGNPPVVLGQGLRLRATETGVVVSGDPGAVPAGARVDVVNTTTSETSTTTAAADGSFELEVNGTTRDEYRVYAASGSESWRTRLTSSGAAAAETGLDGLVFLLSSSLGYNPVPGTTIRLSFNAGQVSLSAGCNSQSGEYSLCDGKLCVSDLASTEIGCEAPLHTQDEWLARFLESSPALTQAGATLTLAGADETLVFLDREVADADRSLTERSWVVDSFIDNGVASNLPFSPPAMLFGSDGSLRVFVSCNTGLGSYTRSGQAMTLELAYTDVECEGGDAGQEHISRVLTNGDVAFEIEAARLTIMRGTLGLTATTE